jgi:hypothetical protein
MKHYPLVALLGLKLTGVPRRERLAAFAMLAAELSYLKVFLLYADGYGRGPQYSGKLPSWDEFVRENAPLTARTQETYLAVWKVVFVRIWEGSNRIAQSLIIVRPSNLKPAERELLVRRIEEEAIRENDTVGSLLREAKTLFPNQPPESMPPPEKSPSPVDIVFQCQQMVEMAERLQMRPGEAIRAAMHILVRDAYFSSDQSKLERFNRWRARTELSKAREQ